MTSHGHLQRLRFVWQKQAVYFITTCVADRKPVLATDAVAQILREEWGGCVARHGWAIGSYVIMPDHVHFFITGAAAPKPLSHVVGKWKEWTAKRIGRLNEIKGGLWQPEFFDHVLRSEEARAEKWGYVRNNPVRAGLVKSPEDWPYSGSIDFE